MHQDRGPTSLITNLNQNQNVQAYNAVNKFLVPLAIPLLLLDADLRKVILLEYIHVHTRSGCLQNSSTICLV